MGWLDKLGENIKYAHTVNYLGPAYYVTGQTKEALREQGKEDEARKIEKAEAVGTIGGAIAGLTLGSGIPLLTRGISAFRTAFPKVATGIDLVLTADGVRNLATKNGIQKTINYAKEGNWGRAAISGAVDALDILGGVGLIGDVVKGSKKVIPAIQSTLTNTDVTSNKPTKDLFSRLKERMMRTAAEDMLSTGKRGTLQAGLLDHIAEPVMRESVPRPVYKYFEENVIPRMQAERPWERAGRVEAEVKLNVDGPWGTASDELFNLVTNERVGGIYNPTTNKIMIRESNQDKLGTLIHEIRHRVDDGVPTTQHEMDLLQAAFGPEFLKIPYAIKYNYDTTPDMVTTIGDARRALFGERSIPIEMQNDFIDILPDETITNAVKKGNGYGRELIEMLEKSETLTPERVNAFREAMKYVGMSALPLLLGSTYTNNYKSGGSIHIKKKNKGKFTDYCGGKVTEECIRKGKNSSNPTTRKRANFAANARKWKHRDGGIINYLNMF